MVDASGVVVVVVLAGEERKSDRDDGRARMGGWGSNVTLVRAMAPSTSNPTGLVHAMMVVLRGGTAPATAAASVRVVSRGLSGSAAGAHWVLSVMQVSSVCDLTGVVSVE